MKAFLLQLLNFTSEVLYENNYFLDRKGTGKKYWRSAAICPKLKIIMAHMGGDTWQDGINIALQYNNLYLELCGSFSDADTRSLY